MYKLFSKYTDSKTFDNELNKLVAEGYEPILMAASGNIGHKVHILLRKNPFG